MAEGRLGRVDRRVVDADIAGLQAPRQLAPTVFEGVRQDMNLAQEEVFGPVLAVIPFTTEDEVVQATNSTIYGLAATIWTNDIKRAHTEAVNKSGRKDRMATERFWRFLAVLMETQWSKLGTVPPAGVAKRQTHRTQNAAGETP